MRRRFRISAPVAWLLAGSSFLAAAGCVPQNQYDDLLTAYRAQEQSLLSCQSDLESLRANEGALRSQLSRAAEDLRALESFRDGQGGDLERLRQDYQALLRRLEALNISPLPEALNRELARLASMYGDLVTFDPKRGMLRFNADFTFDLGEATLRSNAAQLIRQLAPILNSPEASSFEIIVLGHTDNVPIGRPETRAKHPTNVHLSAHRAISVRDALVRDGILPGRVQVAGFGEFRPLVPNGPRGAAENRRVEVFLVPASGSFDAPPSGPSAGGRAASAPAPARPRPVDDEPVK
ncbi:MAG TPA: OmpA family protein [Phycisphaerales bacterium]|nr:OmpA family protein [Phycisphaerales bacterium]HMP38454.1 OmpA family protein [Phycisphaerales bacterium]